MKIARTSGEIEFDKKSVITVGTFDGVHLGHQEILKVINSIKENKGLRSVIVTFDPHPQIVLKNKDRDIKILSTIDEKTEIFKSYNIDLVYIINFTKEFSQTSAEDFYKKYLIDKIGITDLVLGYDHMFGKNREGNFDLLSGISEKYLFTVDKINEFTLNGEHISSTKIRNLLLSGEIEKANEMLGREYTISGIVTEGFKRGRELGFPTANIIPDSEFKLIPKIGIYTVRAEIENETYGGMMSIGHNPTVSDTDDLKIEVNIFDFEKDIYGKKITVKFISYIREEEKFESIENLISAMNEDKRKSQNKLIK
ncbi:MAG TPA: bifunctional riboflavin kinase/FAD synthetase [Ignavibacteria bacterium]|nr:bifunctional riboflavin kinase/FAD synthetase [Ignavibacteria bacterium]